MDLSNSHLQNLVDLSPLAVLLLALVNGTHCLGMCGPLSLALSRKKNSLYIFHAGKLLAYVGTGALFGWLGGKFLLHLKMTPWFFLPLLLNFFFLLFISLRLLMNKPMHFSLPWIETLNLKFVRWLGRKKAELLTPFMLGLSSLLLPCGLLYVFLGAATLSSSALIGAGLLLALWVGTLPPLLLAPLALGRPWTRATREWPRSAGVLLLIFNLIVFSTFLGTGFKQWDQSHQKVLPTNPAEMICH